MGWPGRRPWDGWPGRGSAATPTARRTPPTASGEWSPLPEVFLYACVHAGGWARQPLPLIFSKSSIIHLVIKLGVKGFSGTLILF